MNVCHRLLPLSGLAALLAVTCAIPAQTVAPRIRGAIEPTPSVRLAGSANPHTRSATDLGPVPPETPIRGVTLVFSRSPEQQTALDQLLAGQTDPSSPLFHHWLTPAEFAARFDPAPADIASTVTWLRAQGFTIDSTAADRITFSGTASQIQQSFAAQLHRFRSQPADGKLPEVHFAPSTDISLPASLAPVTAAVLHLSDFRPKPSVRAHPNYTTLAGVHYLAPDDIFTMYDLTPFAPQNAVNTIGQGQYVAVVGQSFINAMPGESGISNFESIGGGGPVHMVIVPNSGSEAIFLGDEGESDIDVEYAGGMGKNATLFFVYTGSSSNYGVFDALSYAITQDIAPIVSISYGACEPLMSSSDVTEYSSVLQQAAAQGQTIIASSGDSGATACEPDGGPEQNVLAVNFPADSPYVTAVGGTQMASGTFTTGSNQYWASANTVTGLDNHDSLLSYVPEVVWNESSTFSRTVASGGGASTLFPRPSWQTGVPGIPAGSFRLVPDISLQASAADPGYIICSDDSTLTGAQSDCDGINLQTSSGVYAVAGGTSFAAPILAGSLALLSEFEHLHGLGNINPVLYSLAAQPSIYSSAFHDITTGSTDNGCSSVSGEGIIMCSDPSGVGYFDATTGYDEATGLGTVDFAKLAAAWPSTNALNLTYTYSSFTFGGDSAMDGTATAGSTVSLGIFIAPDRGPNGFVAPTGTVSVSLDGQIINSAIPLTAPTPTNAGSLANVTFTAPSTTGSHILLLNYPGDSTHAASSGSYSLLVGNVVPSGSIALSAANLTVVSNGSGSTPVTITPSGGYSGNLTWTISASGSVATTYCYYVDAPAINGAPGTATIHLGVGTICNSATTLTSRSTTQRATAEPPSPVRTSTELRAAPILAFLLFTLLPRGRRKPLPILAALVVLTLPLALTGCGGGSGSSGTGGTGGGGGGGGSQSQTYTVTVKAQDSVNTAITASTTFTLTVD